MRARFLQIIAGLGILFAATSAQADKRWTGFYIGAHGSYNNLNASGLFDGGGADADLGILNPNGGGVGAQIGYNYQMGKFVFGIEGDIADLDVRDFLIDRDRDKQQLELNSLASIRGRVGYAFNSMLVYGTAGIGFVTGKLVVEDGADALKFNEQAFVYGGGAEYMFAPNLTFRLEYLRYDINKKFDLDSLLDGNPGDNLKLKAIDSVRVGINWKLN